MNVTEFEEQIKGLLQRNIEIVSTSNLKVIRKGTLILYSFKDFFITFVIKTQKGDTKYYNFPMPYDYIEHKSKLVLRYDNHTIHNNKDVMMNIMHELGESKSIFYDNIVNIEYSE